MTDMTGPDRHGSTERCANDGCGHTKRDHSGRRDHTTKHPNVPLRPWCHACETDCLYEPPVDRAATAPVKQRADCTELEWAEQERARFERLYTRETVRADRAEKRAETAARDADIYQQRLERLGEGYTRERKRAERAEAESERLRTYRDATCICQHTEQEHFEDACLVCDCGDYLVPEAAREVIALWRGAATRKPAAVPPVDRAALRQRIAEVLRPHASIGGVPPRYELPFFDGATPSLPRISGWRPLDDVADAVLAEAIARVEDPEERAKTTTGLGLGWEAARDVLRRMADEAQPGTEAACTCADAGDCFAPAGHYADCPAAEARQDGARS